MKLEESAEEQMEENNCILVNTIENCATYCNLTYLLLEQTMKQGHNFVEWNLETFSLNMRFIGEKVKLLCCKNGVRKNDWTLRQYVNVL